jgi:hypothetical protein
VIPPARLAATAVTCLLVTGCSFGETSDEASSWTVRGGSLAGDVDGDGKVDRVAVEDAGSRSCRFRVSARSADRMLTAPLNLDICEGKPAETWGTSFPFVKGLAAIDREPGLEIVVELGHGASTEFATIFGVRNGHLRQWRLPEGTLTYYGSVGTGHHVADCARQKGLVVLSTLVFDEPRSVHRTWYRTENGKLERIRSRRIKAPEGRPLSSEFREPQPFPTCTAVRADG